MAVKLHHPITQQTLLAYRHTTSISPVLIPHSLNAAVRTAFFIFLNQIIHHLSRIFPNTSALTTDMSKQKMNDAGGAFYTKMFDDEDSTETVTTVTLAGSPNDSAYGTTHANSGANPNYHFRIFLGIDGGSVTLDCTPSNGGGVPAIVIVKSNGYRISESASLSVRSPCSLGVTVQGVIDLVIINGLHRYKFDNEGRGCRFWCRRVIQVLEAHQFVPRGAEERFTQGAATWAVAQPDRVPAGWYEGRFY